NQMRMDERCTSTSVSSRYWRLLALHLLNVGVILDINVPSNRRNVGHGLRPLLPIKRICQDITPLKVTEQYFVTADESLKLNGHFSLVPILKLWLYLFNYFTECSTWVLSRETRPIKHNSTIPLFAVKATPVGFALRTIGRPWGPG